MFVIFYARTENMLLTQLVFQLDTFRMHHLLFVLKKMILAKFDAIYTETFNRKLFLKVIHIKYETFTSAPSNSRSILFDMI